MCFLYILFSPALAKVLPFCFFFFFFNDTATTEIYTTHTLFPYTTLFRSDTEVEPRPVPGDVAKALDVDVRSEEHTSELQSLCVISYAVFCLKKKKKVYRKDTVDTRNKKTKNNKKKKINKKY